ncbi:MAG TPA: type II toxin-antitoxin system VapC family toxin [Bdellovibrionota bacterium]|nr:type II toxin-antitoxin system VapC family toxin [Bdellovibrionota bacterium]
MKIAIDTNRYVDFCKGDETAVRLIQQAERVYLPLITIAELRAGFLGGKAAATNESKLVSFLNSSTVSVLSPDEQTTHHYARLFQQLRSKGTPIPTNDIWIAALVYQHDLVLFSRDQHFDSFPQLARVAGVP